MKNILKYSVNIITDPTELIKCLALRFKVYNKTFPAIIVDKFNPFESDQFDRRSIHIGLYCEDQNGKKLVGYNRFILPNIFVDQFKDSIIPHHDMYPKSDAISKSDLLHFEMYLPINYQAMITKFCNQLKSDCESYIETGRFIIDDAHRSISISSFFAAALMALSKQLNIGYAFFTCSVHHAPFYRRLGLTQFPGIDKYDSKGFGPDFLIFGTDLRNFYQNSFNIVKEGELLANGVEVIAKQKAA